MEQPKQIRRRVGTFLGLTFGLTGVTEWLIHTLSPPSAAQEFEYYVLAVTWSPRIAALLTYRIHHQNFAALGLNWTANPYYLVSYTLKSPRTVKQPCIASVPCRSWQRSVASKPSASLAPIVG